jgi:hypothetical protein
MPNASPAKIVLYIRGTSRLVERLGGERRGQAVA